MALSIEQGVGNAAVLQALEQVTAEARKGRIGFMIIATAASTDDLLAGFAGNLTLLQPATRALEGVLHRLDLERINRTTPDPDPSLDASYVCINLCHAPMSYDIMIWVMDAIMTMRREGAPGPLKVCFFKGRDGNAADFDQNNRQQMFDNVLLPLLKLLGAVEDPRAVRGRQKHLFVPLDIMKAARAGEKIPIIDAPAEAKAEMLTWLVNKIGMKRPVVITLRESPDWPHRNSDLPSWLLFASHLDADSPVIFVRDTAKAHEPIPGFLTCPQASIDLYQRMALYQYARMNMFISNGPAAVAVYSDCPWINFIPMEEDGHPYLPSTPSWWRNSMGMEPGTQFPWARWDQRLIWGKDSYENIRAAWEQYEAHEQNLQRLTA